MAETTPLADQLLGPAKIELPPIIADRSALEKYATCPHGAYLCRKHNITGGSKLADTGQIVHELIHEAIVYCEGDTDYIADYFLNELPKVRPDIQPEAIKAARFVCDELANMPIDRLIAVEKQIDYVLLPETATPPGMGRFVITTCPDMLFHGHDDALVVYDWKTGFKRRNNEDARDAYQTCHIVYILWQMYPTCEVIHFFYKETRWGSIAYARLVRTEEHPRLPHLTTEAAFAGRIMEAAKLWLADCRDAWPERKKCLWCDAISKCKFGDKLAMEVKTNTEYAVDHYQVLQAICDKYKEAFTDLIQGGGEAKGSAVYMRRKKPAKPKFTLEAAPLEKDKPEKKKKPKSTSKQKGIKDGKEASKTRKARN